ncbi:MAG: hypothetical protein DBX47_01230 [Clostridiales bacterium]|nr:MAG: hypothetical protein DBX47_01230 [Clostridiales bacterium]
MSKKKKGNRKIKFNPKVLLLLLIPLGLGILLCAISPFFPDMVEGFFSRGVFIVLSHIIGFFSGLIPFSLTEVMLYVLIAVIIICIVLMIMKKLKFRSFLYSCLGVFSFAFLLYMLMHGVNFYRHSAYELMGYDNNRMFTSQEIYSVCKEMAEKANLERLKTNEDENGFMTFSKSLENTLADAKNGYKNIVPEYEFLFIPQSRVKSVMISPLWSYTGICGLYMPLFCEPNVNTDVPECRIPMNAAHELAHTCGFAREDECNFFAYISCINSENADYRYSGYLFAFTSLSNELYSIDKELYNKVYSLLSDKVKNDLHHVNDYWKKFEGKIMDASDDVNDAFIKAQGVESGVQSYNDAVLLIMHYELQK